MATADTTISSRAFALSATLLLLAAGAVAADDKVVPPRLPVAIRWSVQLTTAVATAPVSDGERIFLALRSAHLVARDIKDGHELWRIAKDVSSPFAADGGLVFVPAGEAIEALRATDGATAWIVPRITTVAPLLAVNGLLFALTDTEIIAIHTKDGAIAWRHAAGGVRRAPGVDGDRLYLGADDGRIVAMDTATGTVQWEKYVPLGVTTLTAYRGLVYAGAGDKHLYCLDAGKGTVKWSVRVGAIVNGHVSADDDRVYFAALDNVIRGVDRSTGNQRWKTPLPRRPLGGVRALGHVVFVPVTGAELVMLFDHDGVRSGAIALPGEIARDAPPAARETPAGLEVFVVTGGLSNQWQLTFIAAAGEAAVEPFAALTLPGAIFLTDPQMDRIAGVLPWLILVDPAMRPLSAVSWPIVLRDPPLEPLTTLPGLQLRPLSPVLPSRRGG